MLAAKQNQKFPFHFLSAPPTPPAEERGKVRKIFGFCIATEGSGRGAQIRNNHQDLAQNTFELRPVDTAKIQNSNSRQNSGRHEVPTNGLNSRQAPRVQEFSTLRVARRLPILNI